MEIHIFEDFVPEFQLQAIMEFIESGPVESGADKNDEKCLYYAGQEILNQNPFIHGIVSLISDRVKETAENSFGCKLGDSGALIAKSMVGNSPEEHADSQNMDGTPKAGCENFFVSAVVYVNGDFGGGELVFPKIGYSYKPVPGSCIMFPSHVEYSHYVASVLSGERIALPFWFPKYE